MAAALLDKEELEVLEVLSGAAIEVLEVSAEVLNHPIVQGWLHADLDVVCVVHWRSPLIPRAIATPWKRYHESLGSMGRRPGGARAAFLELPQDRESHINTVEQTPMASTS